MADICFFGGPSSLPKYLGSNGEEVMIEPKTDGIHKSDYFVQSQIY